jgi:outer membrane scaffolding protein for murein synthesis (MipA/OmpV family)
MRLLWLLLLAPISAFAQFVPEDYTLVGLALRSRPAYDGSETQRTDVIPVLRYYGQPWFARTTQGVLEGGARWYIVRDQLHFGVQLAYEEGRKTSESDLLESLNLPDVHSGASVGAHIEWDSKIGRMPISLLGRYRQHTDSDRGSQFDLRFNAGLHSGGGFILAAYAQATWASSKAVRSFYALADADGGLQHASIGLLGSHDMSRHWSLVGGLQGRRLYGDATDSAIVETRSSFYANGGIAYRF